MLVSCRTAEALPRKQAAGRRATPARHGLAASCILGFSGRPMTLWTEELAEAEAQADRFQAREQQAQEQFHIVRAQAEQDGDAERALQSPEFQVWMDARRATDLAWGSWALLKDGKAAA
jgi:hypothetical protein